MQLVKRGGTVAQMLLRNGLVEVLCNVIYCLHQLSLAKCVMDVIDSDVEHLFLAVAHITFWYVDMVIMLPCFNGL